ncbi:centromere protein I [Anabrus simplex]|uniref:centromere protein I n=1 Tax=Anabrus simplex TaxID=316456 RepID=UPI0035A3AE4C
MDPIRDKESAIRFLRRCAGREKGPVNRDLFKEAVTLLHGAAMEEGLEDSDIETCISFIIKPFVGVSMKKNVLLCLFPVTIVPDSATKKLLYWIFTEYRRGSSTFIARALKWLIGLLEFGLTDPAMIDNLYPLYYHLLRVHNLVRSACKLIFLLTKPEDVTRWRVEQILRIQRITTFHKSATAVLSLFKAYRPEYVPESVPAMSVANVFGKLPEQFLEGFQAAAARKEASGLPDPWLAEIRWNIAEAGKAAAQQGQNLIPAISYIHFESLQYRSEDTRPVMEFKTIEDLCSYQLTLDIPCNVMSLLNTPEGRHILAFADFAVQSRFSFALYFTLYQVFLTMERNAPISEKKNLLQQVWELEQYMLQGIPVVSHFLSGYMNIWNGEDFFEEVLQLLQWITYSSYTELNECILFPLRTYFRVSLIDKKCAIIRMLGRMLRNLLIVKLHRTRKKLSTAFKAAENIEDGPEVARGLSQFIGDLCVQGLLHIPRHSSSHALLLDEALFFYEMILEVEIMSGLAVWTVLPPVVLYECFFSRSAVLIDRICSLLLRYKQVMYPKIKEMGFLGTFEDVQETLNQYVSDLGNCLWNGTAISHAQDGYVFKDMDVSKLKDFLRSFNMDRAFSLLCHIAFAPYLKEYFSERRRSRAHVLSRSGALGIIGEEFPSIRKFILVYVERNFPMSPSDE